MSYKVTVSQLIRSIMIGISAGLLLIGLIEKDTRIIFFSISLLWIHNMYYSLLRINDRCVFFCFEVCFFVFLIGGTFLSYLENGEAAYSRAYDIELHTYLCLYISQLFLWIGTLLAEKNKSFAIKKETDISFNRYVQLISLALIVISFLPYLINVYDKIDYVSSGSYESIYIRNASSLPFYITKTSHIFTPSLFIYLGTLPSKRKCMIPLGMYVLANLWSVNVGARANFARAIMVVVFYFLIREKIADGKEHWVGYKEVLTVLILTPVIIVFMYGIAYSRWGDAGTATTTFQKIEGFFVDQGVSITVIHNGKQYQDMLPDNSYVFGPVWSILKYNSISKAIFGFAEYGRQSVEQALYGVKFSDAISYLVMPRKYLVGYGTGSCYIAEVYHCYGYLGVVLINIFFSYVFSFINKTFGKNPWISAFSLLAVYRLVYTPRATTLSFISETVNITNIVLFLGVYLLARILYSRFHFTNLKPVKGVSGNEIYQIKA